MKKTMTFLFAGTAALALSACGGGETEDADAGAMAEETAETAETTDTPVADETDPAPVEDDTVVERDPTTTPIGPLTADAEAE